MMAKQPECPVDGSKLILAFWDTGLNDPFAQMRLDLFQRLYQGF
jgi:hypothetical protein